MRTQLCREAIELKDFNCYGMSSGASSEVKLASKFCREKAPYLEMQSTKSITAIRVIQDPIIQGRVLEMIKNALDQGIDPRTGEKFKRNKVGVVTTPMIKWMIEWATTGKKPAYIKRGSEPKTKPICLKRIESLTIDIMACKKDLRTGDFVLHRETMDKVMKFYEECLCKAASQ